MGTDYSLIANEAIALYSMSNVRFQLLRHNENMTYCVDCDEGRYLLRIHQSVDGFDTGLLMTDETRMTLVHGEMEILRRLNGSLGTQLPVPTTKGGYVGLLDGHTPVTLLTWRDGDTLRKVGLNESTVSAVGRMTARMTTRMMDTPRTILRYHYDVSLVKRVADEICRAAESGELASMPAEWMQAACGEITRRMSGFAPERLGIVHGDLSVDNILITGGRAIPIDFSLSGWGWDRQDLAGALTAINDIGLRRVLWNAYAQEMGSIPDEREVEPFFALSVLLFIACQHTRFYHEQWFVKACERWTRDLFRPLCEDCRFLFVPIPHSI